MVDEVGSSGGQKEAPVREQDALDDTFGVDVRDVAAAVKEHLLVNRVRQAKSVLPFALNVSCSTRCRSTLVRFPLVSTNSVSVASAVKSTVTGKAQGLVSVIVPDSVSWDLAGWSAAAVVAKTAMPRRRAKTTKPNVRARRRWARMPTRRGVRLECRSLKVKRMVLPAGKQRSPSRAEGVGCQNLRSAC
jgi:hypothetical protein